LRDVASCTFNFSVFYCPLTPESLFLLMLLKSYLTRPNEPFPLPLPLQALKELPPLGQLFVDKFLVQACQTTTANCDAKSIFESKNKEDIIDQKVLCTYGLCYLEILPNQIRFDCKWANTHSPAVLHHFALLSIRHSTCKNVSQIEGRKRLSATGETEACMLDSTFCFGDACRPAILCSAEGILLDCTNTYVAIQDKFRF